MINQPNWSALAEEYASEHATTRNQICHCIGIPLIVLALIRWTQWPAGSMFPWLALALPIYYFWSIRLGIAMTIVVAVMAVIAYCFISMWIALALFIIGWIFQLAGHAVFEKNRPSLTHNLVHLFVGPAWILQKLVHSTVKLNLW